MVMGDMFTTEKLYKPEVKAKAYELFLTTALDLTDIALSLNLPRTVVSAWSKQGDWLKRKHEIEVELFRSADDKYRRFLIEKRVPTLERHLVLSAKVEELIETMATSLKEGKERLTPVALEKLAKALASATSVSARAAGINDALIANTTGPRNPEGAQTPPVLIMVGGKPESPAGMEPIKTINVREEPHENKADSTNNSASNETPR